MNSFKNVKSFILLVGFFVVIQATTSSAQDAKLKNIIVTNTRDDLLIYLTVEGAFREKMEKAIASGVPATFSFYVNLYRVRDLWINKGIADLKVIHSIKYDNLKNEYVIYRSWDGNDAKMVKSFDDAKKLMAEIDSLKVLPLSTLEKGMQYQIRTKAQLSKMKLPFYLHYVLFFVSMWDFETDWYTIDFIY